MPSFARKMRLTNRIGNRFLHGNVPVPYADVLEFVRKRIESKR